MDPVSPLLPVFASACIRLLLPAMRQNLPDAMYCYMF
jgi:hypothetical protein